MSFAFKRKECIAKGVCRIARKQVDKALKSCAKSSVESIHTTRKQIKKLRALLRLVRCGVGKKRVENAFEDLREAAGYLAGPRDAHVKQQALDKLARPNGRKSRSSRFIRIRTLLERKASEQTGRFRTHNCARKVQRILDKMPRKFGRLHFKEEDWEILGPAIKRAYRAAQEAGRCALEDSRPAQLHEWRKRVKDLLYTVELLEPIWPEQMSALAAEFERLTEFLGDHHDLEMLRQTVVKNSLEFDLEQERRKLLPLIDAHQEDLRRNALRLGNRLFDESPSKFCTRLHQYWKSWKSKKRNRPAVQRDMQVD